MSDAPIKRAYKLKKQRPDDRDLLHVAPPTQLQAVDLRPLMPPVLDQGELGACASHAACNALHYLLKKESLPEFSPSRLFLYYNTRVKVEGSPADEDTGVAIRDVCKALTKWHVCDEKLWPYVIPRYSQCPPTIAYAAAKQHLVLAYKRVHPTVDAMKATLAGGVPIVIGLQIYESFESRRVAATGLVPMPNPSTEQLLGGHALLVCGFDDQTQRFTVCNSWSGGWGDKGYCYIPYAYVTDPDLAADFWAISRFE